MLRKDLPHRVSSLKWVFLITLCVFLALLAFPFTFQAREARAAYGDVLQAAPPHIDSLSPEYGSVGTEVKIKGNSFGGIQSDSYVSFGSNQAQYYLLWSDTEIRCKVPSDTYGKESVTVSTVDGTSNSADFYVPPHIDSIDPDAAPIGCPVEIIGSGFGPGKGAGYVEFGSATASDYISWSNSSIVVRVPRVSGEVSICVITDSGIYSNGVPFEVVQYGVGFAEGYTGNNFQQYLCIGNPNDYAAQVEIYYFLPDSTYLDDEFSVPARSRKTIDVNNYINPYFEAGSEVSTIVFSDLEVVVERPMYFNYQGRWTGGHDVVATPYISKLWLFAEGYTGPGFEEYICVFNPNPDPANLIFHFLTQEAGEIERPGTVPAASRRTFKVNDLLGADYQCSLALESDQYVVAERPMYFDYTGRGNHHWEGGHCVMGQPYIAREYYFAEGTTRPGFEEWLTMLNPYDEPITIIATYQLGEGQGTPVMKSYVIPPLHRYTVNVADEVGGDKDVSVKLASEYYFLAERPIYFRYTGHGASWEGGHCVIGASELSPDWFFAEGCTGSGFQEWICLQNPGDEDAVVEVSYLGKSGVVAVKQYTISARSRATLRVNDEAGGGLELSCQLRVVSGPPIMAERPIYFNFRGWDGGHDVVGYCPVSFGSAATVQSAGLEQGMLLRDLEWEPGEKKI
ncbi:MAG: hypothetical protein C4536_09330 [Actinobacteria bacterium]|jgi:hypothetical protein|nr:MAG: hypothetical protein C4536_09330 [Actinomycetota bacterium]